METPSEITSSASIEKPPSPIQKKSALHKCVNDIKKRGAWNTKLSDMHPSLLSQCIIRPINIISPGYNQVLAIGEEFSSSSAVNLFLDNNHYQLINNAVKNPSDLIELEKAKQLESTNAPEDGNCLFAATAKYLNNLQINYASLRQKLGDWVADNPNHSLAQGFVINEII
ncbi:OTU domain-containing protein [Microbulbifer sp. SSSA008]|uniref:OTU domain-containing protein n=1 Tax=Microbulbifer sp. SSSA008 TaxID=3243380 RepID=UPI00403A2C14